MVRLMAISPIAYTLIKEGETLRVDYKPAKKNEYREKIGPAVTYYLVMKGSAKIGMIPNNYINENPDLNEIKKCKVLKINEVANIIEIMILSK